MDISKHQYTQHVDVLFLDEYKEYSHSRNEEILLEFKSGAYTLK
ncbi:MAG: hypothetical protein P1U74_05050 [Legionellaceae bacterium]|nr:hypothetical protein [Legionellaceae bacterium]